MAELNLLELMDNDKLREELLRYMLANDVASYDMASDIGISYNTFKGFLEKDRITLLRNKLKIIKFLGLHLDINNFKD